MDNLIIRDFQNSDAEDVVELIRANYGDTYYYGIFNFAWKYFG